MSTGMFPTGAYSGKRSAQRCSAAVRGFQRPNTAGGEIASMAVFLAVQNRPIAPAEEYERWFAKQLAAIDPRARADVKMDGRKLRRAVQMIRNGCWKTEISRIIGVSGGNVAEWLSRLPEELRP